VVTNYSLLLLVSFLMVVNRLVDPKSKLAISRWYKEKIYLRELKKENFAPHDFYRSMDCLEKIKEDIERFLYNKLCDLFTLKLNLVFYDTTLNYLRGEISPLNAEAAPPFCHSSWEDKQMKGSTKQIIMNLKRMVKLLKIKKNSVKLASSSG